MEADYVTHPGVHLVGGSGSRAYPLWTPTGAPAQAPLAPAASSPTGGTSSLCQWPQLKGGPCPFSFSRVIFQNDTARHLHRHARICHESISDSGQLVTVTGQKVALRGQSSHARCLVCSGFLQHPSGSSSRSGARQPGHGSPLQPAGKHQASSGACAVRGDQVAWPWRDFVSQCAHPGTHPAACSQAELLSC